MAPFVEAGLFADISDVWEANGLNEQLASAAAVVDHRRQAVGVPYTYYQWGIYYNRDAYKKAGVDRCRSDLGRVPRQLREVQGRRHRLRDHRLQGAVAGRRHLRLPVPAHQRLPVPHRPCRRQDLVDRSKPVGRLRRFAKLQPYVTDNHAAIDWQDAAAIFVQGKAANYVMGNFAVGVFKEGGMTNDNLGFMVFPEITAGIARAEEAPTDTIHLTAGAKNPEDAKTFLAYRGSAPKRRPSGTRRSASCRPTRTRRCRRRSVPDGRLRDAVDAPMRSPSSGTATRRPKWPRPAWKASSEFLVQPELEEILARSRRCASVYK